MSIIWKKALAALLLLAALPSVHAAINCTVGAPALNLFYQEQTTARVQMTLTVNCTRTSTNGPSAVNYTITPDNGDYPTGTTNRARRVFLFFFPFYLSYDLYTNSSCATMWSGTAPITGSLDWPSNGTGTLSQTHSFWACMPAQNVQIDGTYDDNVQFTMQYNNQGQKTVYGSMDVNIIAPASCVITTPPGNIVLNYTAFSPTAVVADSTVGMRCTASMPYTLEILPPNDVLAGVRYSVVPLPASGTGTGNPVNHTIRATAPAGQPGECAAGTCSQTRTHELRITY